MDGPYIIQYLMIIKGTMCSKYKESNLKKFSLMWGTSVYLSLFYTQGPSAIFSFKTRKKT